MEFEFDRFYGLVLGPVRSKQQLLGWHSQYLFRFPQNRPKSNKIEVNIEQNLLLKENSNLVPACVGDSTVLRFPTPEQKLEVEHVTACWLEIFHETGM